MPRVTFCILQQLPGYVCWCNTRYPFETPSHTQISRNIAHLWYPLTHWPLIDLNKILDKEFSSQIPWLMAEVYLEKLLSDGCHWILLMISQHWFRWWLGAVRQQAITWGKVDPDLCRHMVSLGHNEATILFAKCRCQLAEHRCVFVMIGAKFQTSGQLQN